MSDIFTQLKKDLEKAIANEHQGRALTIVNNAWGYYNDRRMRLDEVRALTAIYDEWEASWE